jgi:hypothetical protein
MTAMGHVPSFWLVRGMSAHPPTAAELADILQPQLRATSGLMHCSRQQLFDDLVCEQLDLIGNDQSGGLGSPQIDHEFKFGRLLNR